MYKLAGQNILCANLKISCCFVPMVGHRALTVLDNKHNWKENIAASRTIVNYQTIIETGQEGISWYEQPHSDLNSLTRPVTVQAQESGV